MWHQRREGYQEQKGASLPPAAAVISAHPREASLGPGKRNEAGFPP
jgi:hypothetical protein